MDSGTDRLVERPPSSRFSYAQMSRFPDYVESYNPTISDINLDETAPNGIEDEVKPTADTAVKVSGGNADVQDKSAQGKKEKGEQGRNMYFKDGKRRIDYVLAWELDDDDDKHKNRNIKAREIFEKNLREEGLQLEEDLTVSKDEEADFMKVHAPYEVLTRYAEILKLKMPVKKNLVLDKIQMKYSQLESLRMQNPMKSVSTKLWTKVTGIAKRIYTPFQLNEDQVPHIKRRFTLVYSRDKEYLFDIPEDRDTFFDNATRSRIVNFILRRKSFSTDKNDAYSFGINKMINDNIYTAAYSLHEGHWKPGSASNERKLLFDHWGNWRNMFKVQPLEHVRNYFGAKIGIYFTWLGFYTMMLIPASIVGLVVFIYGIAVAPDSYPAKEICDPKNNFTMCPLCDFQCPYWNLYESCSNAIASRMFDNGGTVFFAIFMSFWGTLFLEFWKRRQASMQYKWDLLDYVREEQPPRPEYLARLENCTHYRIHPITGLKEPHLPFWTKRVPIFLMSYSIMFFLGFLAIAAVFGVIAYRVSVLAALQVLTKDRPTSTNSTLVATTTATIYENASLVTTVTAACINLLIIIILNMIYSRLAFWLTDLECLRTQKEYDDSITLKLFALQFVNYYSSIIYIAFFKGRIIGRPGKYTTMFGARQEECAAGGCLIELCIQLAIIMTGKQLFVNNFTELVLPKLIKMIKRCLSKETKAEKASRASYEKDYKLEAAQTTSLFYEYLEMVLQFGFLTIFVAAFPLGPLFSLINNIIEIRMDSSKMITHLRRPLADRSPDIGIWYSVLYGISRIAIISNAFIIALTSDYIPRMVYLNSYSKDDSLKGYLNHTMSYFNTSDFEGDHRPTYAGSEHIQICRYRDFRNPPWSENAYEFSQLYWHILAARFVFVVVFQNVIVFITGLIAWLIPDVPAQLKVQIRREAYISNEIIIKTELLRAQGKSPEEGEAAIEAISDVGPQYQLDDTGSAKLKFRKSPGNSPEREEENIV
ncbi:anoctamin-1-like isoform X4 [Mytilus galloprovincialis]|uniref:anoctamin-1-like isoform X4 n=1 Tax=Mytilus galloprovincialis TaxID=29158 RepID=UPI003F7B7A87